MGQAISPLLKHNIYIYDDLCEWPLTASLAAPDVVGNDCLPKPKSTPTEISGTTVALDGTSWGRFWTARRLADVGWYPIMILRFFAPSKFPDSASQALPAALTRLIATYSRLSRIGLLVTVLSLDNLSHIFNENPIHTAPAYQCYVHSVVCISTSGLLVTRAFEGQSWNTSIQYIIINKILYMFSPEFSPEFFLFLAPILKPCLLVQQI